MAPAVQAQQWCPPGAEWTFNYHDVLGGHEGYLHVAYGQDTLLNGLSAQCLDAHAWTYDHNTAGYVDFPHLRLFTTFDGNMVRLWDAYYQDFDTLFRFDAVPGDRWGIPWHPSLSSLVVVDTLHTMIDGMLLRQIVVGFDQPGSLFTDTITERIGALSMYIDPFYTIGIDGPVGGLRCYTDLDIQYIRPEAEFGCFSMLSVNEYAAGRFSVYPNPGRDRVRFDIPVELAPVVWQASIFDARGVLVMDERLVDREGWINTGGILPGLYTIKLHGSDDRTYHFRWVRE